MGVGDRVYCKPYERYGVVVSVHPRQTGETRFMILWDGGDMILVGNTFLQPVGG